MNGSILNLIAAFLISIVLTGVLIPKILLISFRKNLFDIPDARKIHTSTVPRLGGLAFMPAIFFTIAALLGINWMLFTNIHVPYITFSPVTLCFGMCALMIVYLVGIADDLIGVKYRAKFAAQIMAAVLIVSTGMWIHNLDGFLGIYSLSPWIGIPLSILVIVFIMNAINLIDGIDGLASGLSAMAFMLYAIVAYIAGQIVYAIACCAILGTLVPLFYYNVFGDAKINKKIFMGDTGSLTTGLMLSFMAFHICNIRIPMSWASDTFVVAFSPLIIPCFDVIRVFGNRILHHHNPFTPDMTHIHHKLLACGLRQRHAMIIIVAASAILTTANIISSPYLNITWLVIIDLVAVFMCNYLLNIIIARHNLAKRRSRLASTTINRNITPSHMTANQQL